jgi:uncharacterized protein (TIGR00661 family)
MKILYGVCGEGFGHGADASEVVRFLESKGHEVVIITYDQGYELLKNQFKVVKVEGLHSIYEDGILNHKKTVVFNAKNFLKNIGKRKKLKKFMKAFNPDVCISDIEPIVPILSYFYKKPLISVSMVNTFGNFKTPIPKGHLKHYLIARIVRRLITPKANHRIATSMLNSETPKKGFSLVSPVIRQEIKKLKPKEKNFVLVYLSKKSNHILSVLNKINENFVIYGYNLEMKKDNLTFKKRESFLEDLENCKAVISTAGFVLMSEAVYLKKPFFAFPLKGQFEQMFNALVLKENGFGEYSENPSIKEISKFLLNLKNYKRSLFTYKIDSENFFRELEKILAKVTYKK